MKRALGETVRERAPLCGPIAGNRPLPRSVPAPLRSRQALCRSQWAAGYAAGKKEAFSDRWLKSLPRSCVAPLKLCSQSSHLTPSPLRGAFDSAKNHKRQHRKRQSVTAKREKSQTPKVRIG